jgi:hypothetical protein
MRISLQRTLGFVLRVRTNIGRIGKIALAPFLAFILACPAASAEALVSRYDVKIDGSSIGDAVLRIDLDAKRYKVQVSASFGVLLFTTEIQGKTSGARSGAALTPEHFQMVTSGSDEGTMKVDFSKPAEASAGGALSSRGFFDPLSALLAATYKPQPQSNHPCNTILPISTGRDRFVLELQPMPAGSEKEPALTLCQITLSQPIAGGTKLRQYKWKIAFTRSAKRHFWLVERVSLPTKLGTLSIERTETSMSAR